MSDCATLIIDSDNTNNEQCLSLYPFWAFQGKDISQISYVFFMWHYHKVTCFFVAFSHVINHTVQTHKDNFTSPIHLKNIYFWHVSCQFYELKGMHTFHLLLFVSLIHFQVLPPPPPPMVSGERWWLQAMLRWTWISWEWVWRSALKRKHRWTSSPLCSFLNIHS